MIAMVLTEERYYVQVTQKRKFLPVTCLSPKRTWGANHAEGPFKSSSNWTVISVMISKMITAEAPSNWTVMLSTSALQLNIGQGLEW